MQQTVRETESAERSRFSLTVVYANGRLSEDYRSYYNAHFAMFHMYFPH
jgi:hypothetical protein